MLSTVSPDSPMPEHVEEAYRLWLDAAGRNVYAVARILGGRRQTYQDWSTKWRWRDRAELEDVEGRDRAIRLAYRRLQNAATSFVETTILASRCRVDAHGVHYAISDDGKRVDCPAAVAVRAASGGLERLGISPVKAVAFDVTHRPAPRIAASELRAMRERGDIAGLIALSQGKPLPAPTDPPPPDFTTRQPGGRGAMEPPSPVTEDSDFNDHVLDAEVTEHGQDDVGVS